MHLVIYGESFPPGFREHAQNLEKDPTYRANFQSVIQAMPYIQWLESPIWRHTARLKRLIQPTCEGCGCHRERTRLEVHHKTYQHIGIEVIHLDDLAVLCPACHLAQHRLQNTGFAYSDVPKRLLAPDSVPVITCAQLRFTFEPGRTTVQREHVTR